MSVRALLFLATIAYVVYLQQNPELIDEIKDAGLKSHDDIIQWGKDKIVFNFTNISHRTITYTVPDVGDENDHEDHAEGHAEINQDEKATNSTQTQND